jgi:hypothetical protein
MHFRGRRDDSIRSTVVMKPTGLPLQEPEQLCEACGVQGTVGRAFRSDADGNPTEIHRFCARCWPEESARLRARWDEEGRLWMEAGMRSRSGGVQPPSPGSGFESATWHGALEFVRQIRWASRLSGSSNEADLAEIARGLEASASEHVGEMPLEIEMFIHEHSGEV